VGHALQDVGDAVDIAVTVQPVLAGHQLKGMVSCLRQFMQAAGYMTVDAGAVGGAWGGVMACPLASEQVVVKDVDENAGVAAAGRAAAP
jgi:hypothetical protein